MNLYKRPEQEERWAMTCIEHGWHAVGTATSAMLLEYGGRKPRWIFPPTEKVSVDTQEPVSTAESKGEL